MPKFSDYDFGLKNGVSLDVQDLAEILDANGNEQLEFDTVASAVNFTRLANAATAGAPTLSAQGDDTNVSLQLSPKGTGLALLGDTSTGTVATGAVTINAQRGQATIGGLNVAAGTVTTFDLVNNKIALTSQIQATIAGNSTITAGIPVISKVQIGVAGSATIQIANITGGDALAGTAVVSFVVLN